jgi:4'-phosphopantetheinyl transferase
MDIYKRVSASIINNSSRYSAWLVDIRDLGKYADEIRHCLSEQELSKYKGIKAAKQRELFCLRKGVTRILLRELFDTCDLQYAYDHNGKPYIVDNSRNIKFNISHSKEYLLIGTSEQIDIGVDVEKINYKLDYALIAKSILSTEELILFNSYNETQRFRSFYKAWVQKEAASKAVGLGLALGFNSFSVNINPELNNEEYSIKISNINYCLRLRVSLENDYALAIAVVEKGVY